MLISTKSSFDPWYLEFSTYLNHDQTKTANGSIGIILSDKTLTEEQKRCSQGQNRDSKGQDRDSQGQNRDNQGQNRDSQGQKRDRGIIGQTPNCVPIILYIKICNQNCVTKMVN